jgi:hypothetical protein
VIRAIVLGLHLAGAGAGPARLRTFLVGVTATIGTALMLCVAAVAHADTIVDRFRYDTADQGMRWLQVAVVLAIAIPILVLAGTAGRLSAALRDRRLANLRLLGLSPRQTRLVAVAETGAAALAGTAVGLVLFLLVRPAVAEVHIFGTSYPLAALTPTWPSYAGVLVVMPLCVIGLGSFSSRHDLPNALARARKADDRRPSAWRLAPLFAGVVVCLAFVTRLHQSDSKPVIGLGLFSSVIMLGVGMILVLPVAVRLMADLLLRSSRGATTTIAARRLQAQPAGVTRVISGLLIGLFVVVLGRSVVVAFESTPQYVAEKHSVEISQVALVEAEARSAVGVRNRIADLPGVRSALVIPSLATNDGCPADAAPCGTAIVLSCAQLLTLAPTARGCRDDEPSWIGSANTYPDNSKLPATLTWQASPDSPTQRPSAARITLPVPQHVITNMADDPLLSFYGNLLIPPTTAGIQAVLANAPSQIHVTAGPGRNLPSQLDSIAAGAMTVSEPTDYDFANGLRTLVWSVGAIVLSIGLLAFGIAAIDRAVSRRREVVSLQLAGVPQSVLRRSQWLEAALPTGLGALLAIGLGLIAGLTYLSLDNDSVHNFPWRGIGVFSLTAVALSLAVAGLTVIASSPKLRPDLVRVE